MYAGQTIWVRLAAALMVVACSSNPGQPPEDPDGDVVPPIDAPVEIIDAGPPDAKGTVTFVREPFLKAMETGLTIATANITSTDLEGDGFVDVLVSQTVLGVITIVPLCVGCDEVEIAVGNEPVRGHVADMDGDGANELVVADIGSLGPTTDLVGEVHIVHAPGQPGQTIETVLLGVGRTACAETGDFDGNGELDIAVCVFGHENGNLLLLEQEDGGFTQRVLDSGPGTIHAFPWDAEGDGDVDIAAVIAQDTEQVVLYVNDGEANFTREVLYSPDYVHYGSSGIHLDDLDQDGDLDILYTNGDMLDGFVAPMPDTVYGVAWLENQGDRVFVYHDIMRLIGGYSAKTVDLDLDGHKDLIVSMFQPNPIQDPEGNVIDPATLIWLENDGTQNFTRHTIDVTPPAFISVDSADVDFDGDMDILAGPMLWNEGPVAVLFRNQLL